MQTEELIATPQTEDQVQGLELLGHWRCGLVSLTSQVARLVRHIQGQAPVIRPGGLSCGDCQLCHFWAHLVLSSDLFEGILQAPHCSCGASLLPPGKCCCEKKYGSSQVPKWQPKDQP